VSTFADFALLAAVPSYGGAEILRAQRVLPMGPGPRVHLALFGRNDRVMHRVVAAANAGAAILHPAIARIYEVSRFDGVVYGVGDPSEGLDLSALLANRRPVPVEMGLAITAAVARVAVAVHDAGGPGYRGPPLGLGAVLSGGLSPDGVFLEPTGAVRLRPLAAAGTDPEVPSAFRAPEEAISMAADVFSLGRLLMALLSGDGTGTGVPRLPTTSPVTGLMTRLVAARASERPHLHEVVTRLEGLLRDLNVGGPDQVVRAALGGPYRSQVVDPGLGLDAPPRVVDTLRMQLAYIYPAVERLWPTMMPMHAPPPPPAFAALPPATSDEGVAVFTDARPAVRRQKAKTAATLMIGAADMAAAVAAVSGEGAAFKPKTSPTLMIPTAELLKALPAPSGPGVADQAPPRAERTMLIDPATFAPFSPPPPPAIAAPAPPSPPRLDVDSERPVTPPRPARAPASSSSSSSSFASSPSPPPPRRSDPVGAPPQAPRRSDPVGAPPRPPTFSAMAVFAGGADDVDDNDDNDHNDHDSGDSEDRTQMLAPEQGNLMERLAAKEHQDALSEAAAFARGLQADARDVSDVFSDDNDDNDDNSGYADDDDNGDNDSGFADSPVSASAATGVAPTPFLSEPGGHTDALALEVVANAATAMAPPTLDVSAAISADVGAGAVARTRPGLPTFAPSSREDDSEDMDDAFAAAFAPVSSPAKGPATHAPAMTLPDDDDGPTASRRASSEDDAPEFIDDGAAFVMVGDAGQTFEGKRNPFGASTRVYPAQALQVARSHSDDGDDSEVDASEVDVDVDVSEDVNVNVNDDDEDDDSNVFSQEQFVDVPHSAPAMRADEDDDIRTEMVSIESLESMMRQGADKSRERATSAPAAAMSGEGPAVPPDTAARPTSPAPVSLTQSMQRPRPVSALEPQRPPGRMAPAPVPVPPPPSLSSAARASVPDGAPMSLLVVEAPEGATVTLNGTVIGTGPTSVDVASTSRAVVKVTMPGCAPFSTVVAVQGRPRVRVTPVLKPR